MYIVDLVKGSTKYPWGFMKPGVVRGNFSKSEIGILQARFHRYLLEEAGFKRTHWQIVFPEQVAGVIKLVEESEYGGNQYHVRFYIDGVIESEIEFQTWSFKHWSGYRKHCWKHVEQIVDSSPFTETEKQKLKNFFETKNYSQPWMS